jgi:hypothetical protein
MHEFIRSLRAYTLDSELEEKVRLRSNKKIMHERAGQPAKMLMGRCLRLFQQSSLPRLLSLQRLMMAW